MMDTCEEIVREYVGAVESAIECVTLPDGRVLIDTPYTYSDGDVVQISAQALEGLVRLSDSGVAMARLEMHGLNIDSQQVRSALREILISYRAALADEELRVDAPAIEAGAAFLRVIGAIREIDALQYLRPQPRPPGFERRVLTYLRSVSAEVSEKAEVTGQSGTNYRLTAEVVRPAKTKVAPVLAQAVSGGRSPTGLRAVNYAYRAFSDIDGDRPPSSKLVILSDEIRDWRSEDIRILLSVAYVGGWWERDRITQFLEGHVAGEHQLFAHQVDLA